MTPCGIGRIELGLRGFLEDGGFRAFTDTFEDLPGITQLPGIAVQRLMADGFGSALKATGRRRRWFAP